MRFPLDPSAPDSRLRIQPLRLLARYGLWNQPPNQLNNAARAMALKGQALERSPDR
jgi:hypothetical protein